MQIIWSHWQKRVTVPICVLEIGDSAAYQRAAVTVQTKEAMDKLFDVLAKRYKYSVHICIIGSRDRNGGYTRIMRCGYRDGDKAPMCYIEYIDR